jgi:hypothetical protein
MSTAVAPDHVGTNRRYWDDELARWFGARARRHWAAEEPFWEPWRIPQSQLPVLPGDASGLDTVELGCGTGLRANAAMATMPTGTLTAIVLDCRRAAPQARFWAEALGWAVRPYDDAEVTALAGLGLTPETDPAVAVDSPDGSLTMFCVEVPEPKIGKLRMHLDVRVDNRDRFDRLLSLGARVVERRAEWTVMADPEGNEFCVFGQGAA